MKYPARTLRLIAAGLFILCAPAACDGGGDGDAGDGDGDGDEGSFDGDGDGDGGGVPASGDGDGDGDDNAQSEGGAGGIAQMELPEIPAQGNPMTLPDLGARHPCGLADAPYLMGGNVDTSGFLVVQDDISGTQSLGLGGGPAQLDGATALDGATSHVLFPDGTAYVSFWEKPIIEKWKVGPQDVLQKQGTLQLARSGVSSTGSTRQLVQVISSDKAYYVDPENNYVLGFNPSTMESDGVLIDLTEGFGPANDIMALGDVHRDGDHLIISARFWDEDFNVQSIVRAAFIDATDDSVTFAEETRCGDVVWQATDSAGHLYLGSHYDNVGANHVEDFGITGTDSCIVRIKRGERTFDQDYYVDLDALVGGIGTTLLEGPGDRAYVMKYVGDPITAQNWDAVRSGASWELHAITLGAEDSGSTPIDLGGELFNPTPTPFCTDDTQTILGLAGANFERGQLFVIDSENSVTPALSYAGALGQGVSLE